MQQTISLLRMLVRRKKVEKASVQKKLRELAIAIPPQKPMINSRFALNNFGQLSTTGRGMSHRIVSAMVGRNFNLDFLPIDSYLLVLDSNSQLPNPQPKAELKENQLHVVIGKW